MAKRTINTINLGIFITVALALFIFAVYLIGSKQNMFGPALRISTVFSNVNGLQPGNNVRFSGINVGTVESITLLSDTAVQVNMKLEKKVQPYIKKDAVASIGSDGLVGSMLVNISPGAGQAGPVEDGGRIDSYSRVEAEELLNTLGKTNENIALISNDLLRITQQLVKGKGTLAMLLRDTSLALSLSQSIENLQASSRHFSATAAEARQLLNEARTGGGLFSQLLYDTSVLHNLNATIGQADSLIAQAAPTLDELHRSAEDITAASQNLKAITESLYEGDGLASRLMHDTSLANSLGRTLENLDEGTARFSENMKAMREHFLFRGYFRRLEKEKEKRKD